MNNKKIKTILCYGDSNTYGYNPLDGSRFPKNIRWPGVLQNELGKDYEVIEEGLNGRTINYTEIAEPYKNGYYSLKAILGSHRPIDILIFMLGTNDLKFFFHQDIDTIATNMENMIKEAKTFLLEKQEYLPTIILCSPIPLHDNILNSYFVCEMDQASLDKSKLFSEYYQPIAEKENCLFFDVNKMFKPSILDCMHMDAETHKNFGLSLAKLIRNRSL